VIVFVTARCEDAAVVTIPNATTSVSTATPVGQRKRCKRFLPVGDTRGKPLGAPQECIDLQATAQELAGEFVRNSYRS
jgi:hypothetical protein